MHRGLLSTARAGLLSTSTMSLVSGNSVWSAGSVQEVERAEDWQVCWVTGHGLA